MQSSAPPSWGWGLVAVGVGVGLVVVAARSGRLQVLPATEKPGRDVADPSGEDLVKTAEPPQSSPGANEARTHLIRRRKRQSRRRMSSQGRVRLMLAAKNGQVDADYVAKRLKVARRTAQRLLNAARAGRP